MQQWQIDGVDQPDEPGYDEVGLPLDLPGICVSNKVEQDYKGAEPLSPTPKSSHKAFIKPESYYEPIISSEEIQKFRVEGFDRQLQVLSEDALIYSKDNANTVNLATLQRINLSRLQRDLVEEAFRVKYKNPRNARAGNLGDRIHKYVQALQDWEYSKQCALRGKENDPFIVTTKKTIGYEMIQGIAEELYQNIERRAEDQDWFSKLEEDMKKTGKLAEPRERGGAVLFGGPRNVMNEKEALRCFLRRVGMAGIGGAFLIGPMILMVLHKSLLTTLLTASLCVCAFGLIMAIFLDQPFDVLSATAAYAAVLVVFVGTSNSG